MGAVFLGEKNSLEQRSQKCGASTNTGAIFLQTCFSMRGSDWSMVENSVNTVDLGARLRAQFFSCLFDKNILRAQFIACFADTAVVARTVFTILFENRRSETHSFYDTF